MWNLRLFLWGQFFSGRGTTGEYSNGRGDGVVRVFGMSARDKLNIMRKYKIVFLGDQSGKCEPLFVQNVSLTQWERRR